MENKRKGEISTMAAWFIKRLWILLPSTFAVLLLLVGAPRYRVAIIIVVLAIIGYIVGEMYKLWQKAKMDIDIEPIENTGGHNFLQSLKKEWLHWLIVCVFLFLTGFATWRGLCLLYVGGGNWFLFVFTVVVCLVLLYLLIMISKGKHMLGYAIFYLLFDLATAFSFNFIHFYDNISATQNMDRDVRACDMYIKQQQDVVSKIYNTAEKKVGEANSSIENKIEKNKNNRDEQYRRYNDELDRIKNDPNLKQEDKDLRIEKLNRVKDKSFNTKEDKEIESLRATVEAWSVLKDRAVTIQNMQKDIDTLIHRYNYNKDGFTREDLSELKSRVFDLDAQIKLFNEDSLCKANNLEFERTSDSIQWALHRLKQPVGDRFAGLHKLLDGAASLISSEKSSGKETNHKKDDEKQEISNNMIKSDEEFENRLLVFSVMLSGTIDLIPLFLSLFVFYSNKRKEQQ